MELIEEGFLSKYEGVCVGNKPADAQHVFFEGMLLQEGLGTNKFNRQLVVESTTLRLTRQV